MASGEWFNHAAGRHIACGDAAIYVDKKGNPDLPVLILLHGGFGTMEDFNAIVPALSRQFRLVGVDSRGHGKSSLGTAALSYKRLADDLALVIDALALEKFRLLGFSDGGITAYRYAARQDPRLQKIVTVGAQWEMRRDDPAWDMLSGMTGDVWKSKFPSSYESYIRLNPTPDFDHFAASVVAMWTDLSPDGYPGMMIERIDNEMLVVRGDDDPLTTLGSMLQLKGVAKHMRYMNIPFAGHVAFDDAPEMFLQALVKFFGDPDAPQG